MNVPQSCTPLASRDKLQGSESLSSSLNKPTNVKENNTSHSTSIKVQQEILQVDVWYTFCKLYEQSVGEAFPSKECLIAKPQGWSELEKIVLYSSFKKRHRNTLWVLVRIFVIFSLSCKRAHELFKSSLMDPIICSESGRQPESQESLKEDSKLIDKIIRSQLCQKVDRKSALPRSDPQSLGSEHDQVSDYDGPKYFSHDGRPILAVFNSPEQLPEDYERPYGALIDTFGQLLVMMSAGCLESYAECLSNAAYRALTNEKEPRLLESPEMVAYMSDVFGQILNANHTKVIASSVFVREYKALNASVVHASSSRSVDSKQSGASRIIVGESLSDLDLGLHLRENLLPVLKENFQLSTGELFNQMPVASKLYTASGKNIPTENMMGKKISRYGRGARGARRPPRHEAMLTPKAIVKGLMIEEYTNLVRLMFMNLSYIGATNRYWLECRLRDLCVLVPFNPLEVNGMAVSKKSARLNLGLKAYDKELLESFEWEKWPKYLHPENRRINCFEPPKEKLAQRDDRERKIRDFEMDRKKKNDDIRAAMNRIVSFLQRGGAWMESKHGSVDTGVQLARPRSLSGSSVFSEVKMAAPDDQCFAPFQKYLHLTEEEEEYILNLRYESVMNLERREVVDLYSKYKKYTRFANSEGYYTLRDLESVKDDMGILQREMNRQKTKEIYREYKTSLDPQELPFWKFKVDVLGKAMTKLISNFEISNLLRLSASDMYSRLSRFYKDYPQHLNDLSESMDIDTDDLDFIKLIFGDHSCFDAFFRVCQDGTDSSPVNIGDADHKSSLKVGGNPPKSRSKVESRVPGDNGTVSDTASRVSSEKKSSQGGLVGGVGLDASASDWAPETSMYFGEFYKNSISASLIRLDMDRWAALMHNIYTQDGLRWYKKNGKGETTDEPMTDPVECLVTLAVAIRDFDTTGYAGYFEARAMFEELFSSL